MKPETDIQRLERMFAEQVKRENEADMVTWDGLLELVEARRNGMTYPRAHLDAVAKVEAVLKILRAVHQDNLDAEERHQREVYGCDEDEEQFDLDDPDYENGKRIAR